LSDWVVVRFWQDAASMVRAFHPMVVCFAGALAGAALLFDAFYLVAGTGLGLAALYTVPPLAGLIGCLLAAAEDLGLERPVVYATIAASLSVGLTNVVLVATAAAMWRTGPSDWRTGGQAILLSLVTVLCFAVTASLTGYLAKRLGIRLRLRVPPKQKRVAKASPVLDVPVRVAAKRTPPARRAAEKSAPEQPAAEPVESPEPEQDAPERETFRPPPLRLAHLSEPRPVVPTAEGSNQLNRLHRTARGRAASPTRQAPRLGRPPGPRRSGGPS
jgi:uncharacterized membrane protein